jgi:hypothetical protein
LARVKGALDDTAGRIGIDPAIVENQLNTALAAAQRQVDALEVLTQSSDQTVQTVWANATQLRDTTSTLLAGDVKSVEAAVTQSLLRAALAALLPPELGGLGEKLVDQASTPISEIYFSLLNTRNEAYHEASAADDVARKLFGTPPNVGACGTGWASSVLLVPVAGHTTCDERSDLLAEEQSEAKQAHEQKDLAKLNALVEKWASGEAAPLQIIARSRALADATIRTTLLRVLDVDSLKQKLQDQVQALLPFRKRVTNDLSLPLTDLTVAGFVKFEPSGPRTLELHSVVDVLLDKAEITAAFRGAIAPFSLDIDQVLKVTFQKGIEYTGGTGQIGKLTASLSQDDIVFGPLLSFLAELASWLTVGGGNGPYTQVNLISPSIEAGYRIAIPVITLGITFTNINFFGSILLPFDNKEARVRVALGSVDSPFLISAGIYGGGGYLGLEASARGIEAFDSSFEFGGVGSIGFGPLQGTAYILSGVYIRKDQGGAVLSAIFSAGFTAHIVCFAISAAFTLRLGTVEGGALEGTATLTFSFSIGFARFSYSVTATRRMGQGFKDGGSDATNQRASIDGPVQLAGPWSGGAYCAKTSPAELVTGGISAADHWGRYSACFDQEFRPFI